MGLGDLLARLNGCAQALAAEGLFADSRKKRLPLLPHRIGLITGRDSDAKKDVLRNAALRWPAGRIRNPRCGVQGNTAVAQVIGALQELDALPEVDVIVIARGGGALEDLLPFSSEELIRAVADAATPVVSAIGHEADRPILDDVADLRASTPTDAAKRIVQDVDGRGTGQGPRRPRPASAAGSPPGGAGNGPARVASLPPGAGGAGRHGHRAARRRRTAQGPGARGHQQPAVVRAAGPAGPPQGQIRALSPQKTLDRGYAVVQLDDGTTSPVPATRSCGIPARRRQARPWPCAWRAAGSRPSPPAASTPPKTDRGAAQTTPPPDNRDRPDKPTSPSRPPH